MSKIKRNLNEDRALPSLEALLRELEKSPKTLPERVQTALSAFQKDRDGHCLAGADTRSPNRLRHQTAEMKHYTLTLMFVISYLVVY